MEMTSQSRILLENKSTKFLHDNPNHPGQVVCFPYNNMDQRPLLDNEFVHVPGREGMLHFVVDFVEMRGLKHCKIEGDRIILPVENGSKERLSLEKPDDEVGPYEVGILLLVYHSMCPEECPLRAESETKYFVFRDDAQEELNVFDKTSGQQVDTLCIRLHG